MAIPGQHEPTRGTPLGGKGLPIHSNPRQVLPRCEPGEVATLVRVVMHEPPNRSLAVQRSALQSGALIPLKTELMSGPDERFQLRRLVSATPKHLAKAGPSRTHFGPGISAWRWPR